MKILMVLTSHDQLGNTGRKTGFWLEEFAAPYLCSGTPASILRWPLRKAASPLSIPRAIYRKIKPPRGAVQEGPGRTKALSQTAKLADMKAQDFDTVFYVGVTGPCGTSLKAAIRSPC